MGDGYWKAPLSPPPAPGTACQSGLSIRASQAARTLEQCREGGLTVASAARASLSLGEGHPCPRLGWARSVPSFPLDSVAPRLRYVTEVSPVTREVWARRAVPHRHDLRPHS